MAEEPEAAQDEQEVPAPGTEGEDHRGDPPGYDLDEQEAMERLREQREGSGND